jgi:hypothetical protein
MGPESWRKVAWSGIRRSVTWYFYLGVAVAMLTPKALVSQSSAVQSVIEFVAGLVPALSKFVAISDFPEVTGFYFAVMWLLLPVPTLLVFLRWLPSPSMNFKKRVFAFFGFPVWITAILAVVFVLPVPDGFSLSYRSGRGIAYLSLFSQYRLGLGLFGSIVYAILAASIGIWTKFLWASACDLVAILRQRQ